MWWRNTKAYRDLLEELLEFSREHGLTRSEMAQDIGVASSEFNCLLGLDAKFSKRSKSSRFLRCFDTSAGAQFIQHKFGHTHIHTVVKEACRTWSPEDGTPSNQHSEWRLLTVEYVDFLKAFVLFCSLKGIPVREIQSSAGVSSGKYYSIIQMGVQKSRLRVLCSFFASPIGEEFLREERGGRCAEDVVKELCPAWKPRKGPCNSPATLGNARKPIRKDVDRSTEIAEVLSKLESLHQATAIEYRNLQELLKDSSLVSTKSLAELLPKH
jgi:hypothetical protein